LKHCAQAQAQAHLAFLFPRPPALFFVLFTLHSRICLSFRASLRWSTRRNRGPPEIALLIWSFQLHHADFNRFSFTSSHFLYDPKKEIDQHGIQAKIAKARSG
jgi:hypothetical protein